MADDKGKIDWAMLEASAAEPPSAHAAPSEPASPEAAPAASPRSASTVGKIAFHCSNGHRIVVAATLAGQRGKCSKCGAAVQIPRSRPGAFRTAETQAEVPAETSPEEPQAVDDVATTTMAAGPAGSGGSHAPVHTDPYPISQAEPREDMFSGLVTAGDSHASATEFVELSHQLSHLSHHGEQPLLKEPEAGRMEPVSPSNPTAALVARMFQEMEHGGIVEVHINGGSVILPEFYEPRWSVGSHGLFASRAADGTVTLTAVAWDSIQKIIVRQVNGLPDGMFE